MQPKVSKCVNRVWKQAAYPIPPMRPEEKWGEFLRNRVIYSPFFKNLYIISKHINCPE